VIAPVVTAVRELPTHGVVLPLDDGRYSKEVFVSRSTLEALWRAAIDRDGEVLALDREDAQALGQAGWADDNAYGWMPTYEFIHDVWPDVSSLPHT
jgi:hypothetical protein